MHCLHKYCKLNVKIKNTARCTQSLYVGYSYKTAKIKMFVNYKIEICAVAHFD